MESLKFCYLIVEPPRCAGVARSDSMALFHSRRQKNQPNSRSWTNNKQPKSANILLVCCARLRHKIVATSVQKYSKCFGCVARRAAMSRFLNSETALYHRWLTSRAHSFLDHRIKFANAQINYRAEYEMMKSSTSCRALAFANLTLLKHHLLGVFPRHQHRAYMLMTGCVL